MSGSLVSTEFFESLNYDELTDEKSTTCDMKPKIIADIELGGVTQHNIKILKRLNQIIFPVIYNENFYKYVLEAGELAKLAFYNGIIVGAVCCKIQENIDSKYIYIMTLGCLAPYRRLGIGKKMLEHILNYAEKNKFKKITLHVQVNNHTALEFYKKFGFEVTGLAESYYKVIEPSDAHILQKSLSISS